MKKAIIFDYGRTLYDREIDNFFPETKAVLEHLHSKYKLAIVSAIGENDPPASRLKKLEEKEFLKYFSSILFNQEEKEPIFTETLKRLCVDPKEIAIVDDNIVRGITWGNKNGASTIWFRNGKYKDKLPNANTGTPTHTIERLDELRTLL